MKLKQIKICISYDNYGVINLIVVVINFILGKLVEILKFDTKNIFQR